MMRSVYFLIVGLSLAGSAWYLTESFQTEGADSNVHNKPSRSATRNSNADPGVRRRADRFSSQSADPVEYAYRTVRPSQSQTRQPLEPEAPEAGGDDLDEIDENPSDGQTLGTSGHEQTQEVQEAARLLHVQTKVGQLFMSERIDRDWASESLEQLESRLSGTDFAIECRTSLCRVKASHANAQDRDSFVGGAFGPGAWPGEALGMQEIQPDGTIATVLYFAKQGHSFHQITGDERTPAPDE